MSTGAADPSNVERRDSRVVEGETESHDSGTNMRRESWKEYVWVPGAIVLGLVVGLVSPASDTYKGTPTQARISELLGWTYFFSWSVSFYPQVVANFRTKSVAGLSIEYQILNVIGFGFYFLFNAMNYWSPSVKEEYKKQHGGSTSAVALNDVFFSGHAFLLTVVTLLQIFYYWDYPPLNHSARLCRRAGAAGVALALLATAVLFSVVLGSSEQALDWLAFLTILSVTKVVISVVKYCPQVWMNYQRQSTVGWNIHNVLLDFSGGWLSVAQLLFDAAVQNDWSKVTGDPAKLMLGNVSMLFDVIFMVQHYCLYRLGANRRTPSIEQPLNDDVKV